MIVVQPEGASLQEGWTSLNDGTMFRQVTRFRQTDIDDGSIFYQHQSDDQNDLADSFTFQVV